MVNASSARETGNAKEPKMQRGFKRVAAHCTPRRFFARRETHLYNAVWT